MTRNGGKDEGTPLVSMVEDVEKGNQNTAVPKRSDDDARRRAVAERAALAWARSAHEVRSGTLLHRLHPEEWGPKHWAFQQVLRESENRDRETMMLLIKGMPLPTSFGFPNTNGGFCECRLRPRLRLACATRRDASRRQPDSTPPQRALPTHSLSVRLRPPPGSNYNQFVKNNHPLISAFTAHPLHPFNRFERWLIWCCVFAWNFFVNVRVRPPARAAL